MVQIIQRITIYANNWRYLGHVAGKWGYIREAQSRSSNLHIFPLTCIVFNVTVKNRTAKAAVIDSQSCSP